MDSKVSEKDMREVYFKAYGKEYDSADRKQAPLPLEIAYLVALNKLKREGKYAGGGEITNNSYYECVNHFVYFCLNFPNNFLDAFQEGMRNHLSNKFKDYYNKYGAFGVMIKFYSELDSENRISFTNWILKNYKGNPISSDISKNEYHNIINHFIYFCLNYPNNFLDAFPSYLKAHFSNKWIIAYDKKGSMGAMIQFWFELDAENRKDFSSWIKNNYKGTPLYELGGALADVSGMLPSPLPMSTIQAMAKGGDVKNADLCFIVENDDWGNLELGDYNFSFDTDKGKSVKTSGAFFKLEDAFDRLFDYLKNENGQYVLSKSPKSNFSITEVSFDGKSFNSINEPEIKYKHLFKISAKKINQLVDVYRFKDGGETKYPPVSFIPYKGEEIMFEPIFNEFYVNDVLFSSLDEAKDFIDNGSYSEGGKVSESAFESIKESLKGKSQQERIDALIQYVSEHNWSKNELTKDSGIIKTYSEIFDLEKERVASIFNKYQKEFSLGGVLLGAGLGVAGSYLYNNSKVEKDGKTLKIEVKKPKKVFKYGGEIETRVKSKLSKNFSLPFEVVVYVPSTQDADTTISKEDFANRIIEVETYLAKLFGGFSANPVDGGYNSDEKGLITEDVFKVYSFASRDGFEPKMEKLVDKVKEWCKVWGQEAIGLEFEGDLFYVEA